jgi:hypothetical protein
MSGMGKTERLLWGDSGLTLPPASGHEGSIAVVVNRTDYDRSCHFFKVIIQGRFADSPQIVCLSDIHTRLDRCLRYLLLVVATRWAITSPVATTIKWTIRAACDQSDVPNTAGRAGLCLEAAVWI